MNLVERVKAILLQPKSEWLKIEQEPGDAGFLYSNYIVIVSAIPPVCAFIGTSILGFGALRIGFFAGLIWALVGYVLGLVGVYVMALIIDALAGTFGARRDFGNAMRIAAYAPTAAWVAGVFNLIPALGILGILGLYSIYLLHTGLAALMRPPADKSMIYTIAVIVAAIVIWIVIAAVPAFLFGAMIGLM
jgi:hypothetical protein